MEDALGGWVAVAAFLLSLAAFILSIRAFRQRARYHPQPKLLIEWGDVEPFGGLWVRSATLVNHGDAPARDIRIEVEFAATSERPWESADVLNEGERFQFGAPVIDGVRHGWGAYGESYERDADPKTYRVVTPTVVVRWRQAPFDKEPKPLKLRAPETPNSIKRLEGTSGAPGSPPSEE